MENFINQFTKTDLAKFGVGIVVGHGTSKIVAGIVQTATGTPPNLITKISISVATTAITWMVSDKIKAYTDDKIDYIVTQFEAIRNGEVVEAEEIAP